MLTAKAVRGSSNGTVFMTNLLAHWQASTHKNARK